LTIVSHYMILSLFQQIDIIASLKLAEQSNLRL